MSWRRVAAIGSAAVMLGACSDQGPESAPGSLTAALSSPNGAEGAAVVTLTGEGIGTTTGVGDVLVFRSDEAVVTTLVLVSPVGGELSVRVMVADTTRPPLLSVVQVAGPDDELRVLSASYGMEWAR